MDMPRNHFKHAIAAGKLQIGLWCSLCSPITTEIVSHSGFDWLLLDTEHSPNEVPDVLALLQAVQAGTASAIVRPAWNDIVLIKRFLDIGAQTLLIPFVQSADEARRAVEATRYPPGGIRGITGSGRASRYGRVKYYLKNASREICLLVQVETKSALDQIEAIAEVDGIDGVFIGPNDLSASFGQNRQLGSPRRAGRARGRGAPAEKDRQAGRHPHAQRGGSEALHRLGLHLRRGRRRSRTAGAWRGRAGKAVQAVGRATRATLSATSAFSARYAQ